MAASSKKTRLHVLELYSGIGGTHCALKETRLPIIVAAAVDINNVANDIYKHNFPETSLWQRSIESLSVRELDKLDIDMITMSPPCQPFCRVGKQQDSKDKRTASFFHVLDLLPKLSKMPSYILLENVKGFDTSDTRISLLETLAGSGYKVQEFLLSPLQFGIPNSRLRYYLLAKREPLQFHFPTQDEILEEVPDCSASYMQHVKQVDTPCRVCDDKSDVTPSSKPCDPPSQNSDNKLCATTTETVKDCASIERTSRNSDTEETESNDTVVKNCSLSIIAANTTDSAARTNIATDGSSHGNSHSNTISNSNHSNKYQSRCRCLCQFLEQQSDDYFQPYMLEEKYFRRFWVMDIVTKHSRNTCCFTKRYAHHMDGAGSVLKMNTADCQDLTELKGTPDYDKKIHAAVESMKLRYFSPREIANLLCFPPEYSFPKGLSPIQCYRVLGNSLNVHVVAVLLRLLTLGDRIDKGTTHPFAL